MHAMPCLRCAAPFQQNRCASKIGFLTLQKQILHVQNRNFTRFCSKIRKFPILRAKMEFLTDCAWKHLKKIGYQSGDFHVARKSVQINRVTRANQKISPKISPKATLRKPGSSRCQSSGWRMERSASGAGFEKGARTFICACFLFFPFGVGVRVCVYFALFWWWLIDVDVRLFRSLRVHAGTAIRIRMTKTKR